MEHYVCIVDIKHKGKFTRVESHVLMKQFPQGLPNTGTQQMVIDEVLAFHILQTCTTFVHGRITLALVHLHRVGSDYSLLYQLWNSVNQFLSFHW